MNPSGQTYQFTKIDGLWTNRAAGCMQPCAQFLRASDPAVGSIELSAYQDGGEGEGDSNERSQQLGATPERFHAVRSRFRKGTFYRVGAEMAVYAYLHRKGYPTDLSDKE